MKSLMHENKKYAANSILISFALHILDNLGAEITETVWNFTHYRYNSNHIACSGLYELMCQPGAVRILIGKFSQSISKSK